MKSSGIRNGAGTVEYPERTKQGKTRQNAQDFKAAGNKNDYMKKPEAEMLGRESVQESFARMTQGLNGSYRMMAKLQEDLSERTESDKKAMESLWQEYKQQLPEGGEVGPEAKVETETEIIVKPDGTRVLVITVKTGGVVNNVISMKISEPTEEPNESGNEGKSEAAQETEGMEQDLAPEQLEGIVEGGE